MRTININFDQEEFEILAKVIYALGCEQHSIEKMIGYLSTWGFSYPFVDIYLTNPKEAELTACYRKEAKGSPMFVLGAIFNKQSKKYEFHS